MPTIRNLLESNRDWAKSTVEADPQFFQRLAKEQHPEYLWIGCADSRVPANQILNLLPGEVFVHRNIANLVKIDDPNCMSVLQYAVDVLKVKHVIVTGHYGCGGVAAAIAGDEIPGRLGGWIQSIRDLHIEYLKELHPQKPEHILDRMCELNVLDQTTRLSHSDILKDAWARGQEVSIHSWIYHLEDGIISPLREVIREPVEC